MSQLPADDLGRVWAARRGERAVLHVDTAACGRTSDAVRARIADHLLAESRHGGYVAERAAEEELLLSRLQLGNLLGFAGEEIAFVESASNAIAQLIDAWPLRPGDRIWAVGSEWGPNLAAFADRGLRVEWLDTDQTGALDVDALVTRLRTDRPAAVHLTAAASHRALVQPVAAAVAVCDPVEVPVIVDAAQAVGQIEVEPGAAAIYGTGRKWLCGPRGVGFLAVREPWQSRLRPVAPALSEANWSVGGSPVRRLGSREAFASGRLGLGVAVAEYVELGPARIRERLHGIGVALRTALADLSGWQLRDPVDAPGALVALAPRSADLDVPAACAELLDRGVLGTVCRRERAPHDIEGCLLRLSPHVDTTAEDVETIAKNLYDLG
ncbi:MAG TPA: aminotransferase class V-fold PLP-dependent enzyme [Pseudonocardiaceae bacterium]|nr:aminotransferase class V-fold PLP-dependent enzyme [Pseudonocardiaceae bacterium]